MNEYENEEEEVVAETPAFRVGRRKQGEFHLLRVSGRMAPELLDVLRNKVFLYRCHYGVDLSGLSGVNAMLTRELEETAKLWFLLREHKVRNLTGDEKDEIERVFKR